MIGEKIGRLKVLEQDLSKTSKHKYWICECECGNIKSIRVDHLRNKETLSCGCLQKENTSKANSKDITGVQYGFLVPIERIKVNSKYTSWRCKCLNCGSEDSIHTIGNLQSKNSISCGCIRSIGERRIKNLLKNLSIEFKQEICFKDLISDKGGFLRFDFGIYNEDTLVCLIEYQGTHHYEENRFKDPLFYIQCKDNLKKEYCLNNNIKLIEIPYWNYNLLNEEYLRRLIYD